LKKKKTFCRYALIAKRNSPKYGSGNSKVTLLEASDVFTSARSAELALEFPTGKVSF